MIRQLRPGVTVATDRAGGGRVRGHPRRAVGVFRRRRRVHLGDVDGRGARCTSRPSARFLQDVATDDADDAGLVGARGRLGRAALERPRGRRRCPCTTRRSSWRRSAAASGRAGPSAGRTMTRRSRRARRAVGAVGLHRSRARAAAPARRRVPRPIYGEAAGGRRVQRPSRARPPPSGGATSRPWPLRASDFDVLDHVNNARSLEAVEDELACGASAVGSPAGRGSSSAARSNAATTVELVSDVRRDGRRRRARGVARRSRARCGSRPP